MKRALLFSILSTLLFTTSFAQETEPVQLGAMRKFDFIVEPFYGFPNFYKGILAGKANYSDGEISVKSEGIGPLGGRIEFMLSDKFGLGVETAYVHGKITRTYTNSNGEVDYIGTISRTKIGAIATFNFHFSKNEMFDAYGTGGLGYKYSQVIREDKFANANIQLNLPVAWRLGIGARFFPVPMWGISMNAGVGQGGLINIGTVFKL